MRFVIAAKESGDPHYLGFELPAQVVAEDIYLWRHSGGVLYVEADNAWIYCDTCEKLARRPMPMLRDYVKRLKQSFRRTEGWDWAA